MFELNNFDAIQIGLASPDQIREWSRGEDQWGFPFAGLSETADF